MDVKVLANLNKSTETGRASWFVRSRFHLDCDQIKLAELNVQSVNKVNEPIIFEGEPSDPPPPPDRGSIPAEVGFWVGLIIFSYVSTPM